MNLTGLLVPTYRNMLRTLTGLLDKAEAQLGRDKAEALLSARLAPDMFPLATQIRFAAVQAYDRPRRLRGDPHRPEVEDILNEGRNAGENPGTLAEARARIAQALAYVDSLDANALDLAPEDEALALDLPMGMTFDLTRGQFARDWALGQFYSTLNVIQARRWHRHVHTFRPTTPASRTHARTKPPRHCEHS